MQEFVTKAAFINLEDLEYFFRSDVEKLLKRTSKVDLPVTENVKHVVKIEIPKFTINHISNKQTYLY